MMSQPAEQTIAIHIMTNIARNNGNQTMKFDQLRVHNMRNILLKNRTLNVSEKLFPDFFLRNQN